MTQHKIKVLSDGTRVYSNGTRYKPVAPEERKYAIRRPDDSGAVLYQGSWYSPLASLDDEARIMPETRPDTDAYEHMGKPRKCMCYVCRRPEAKRWKREWLRSVDSRPVPDR